MRRLLHLSDLHFDRVDPAVLEPLVLLANSLQPHLLVVSGDLTQRARAKQFRHARDFLDRLPHPQLVVPGNHDVPLFNVFGRFLDPLANYRRIITDDLEPFYRDSELAVLGINTARSLTHKGGRIATEQVADVSRRFSDVPESVVKVVVTHHPFDLPDPLHRRHVVGRASLAMKIFAKTGVDLLLAGHFHASHARASATHYPLERYSAVVVQASTATSSRLRREPNAFNLVEIEPGRIALQAYSWEVQASSFRPGEAFRFDKGAAGWLPSGS